MDKDTSFELKKEKFTYEIKDFEPVIRKKERKKGFKIMVIIVVALLICFIGAGLYKTFIYREKLTAEKAVERALSDCVAHAFGKEAYIIEDIGGEAWYDVITKDFYEVEASIRLKSLADFGLGIEQYVSGAGIKTDMLVDAAGEKLSGKLDVVWTIITVPVLEYSSDNQKLVLTSPDFFEESILLNYSYLDFSDWTVGGIFEAFAGYEMTDSAYKDMTIKELLDMSTFECEYYELKETKTFVVGEKEETCYGYRVVAENELFPESVEFLLYVDREYRLVSLAVNYAYTDDEARENLIDISLDLAGANHPTDNIKGEFIIKAGEDAMAGSFQTITKNSEERVSTDFVGELSVAGIEVSADVTLDYEKESRKFSLDADLSDGYNPVEIDISGEIVSKEDEKLEMDIDMLEFKYRGEEIFTAGVKLGITIPDETEEISVSVKEPVINLPEMTEEEFDGIYEQVLDKLQDYLDMAEDFF